MAKTTKSTGMLLLLLLIGSIFGTLIGEALNDYFPFLRFSQSIGVEPTTIDLAVISLTLGATLRLNIATIIGFFITLFIYFRL
ncbi:MAG: DUF4321 domain-containing protein [Dethiobacteria bacterium]|jgi:hypothetical protein|nr:DUF4321 domain-containing protein [Bacillota bacterium]